MHVKFEPISCSCESTIHSSPLCISGGCCCCLAGRLQVQPALAVFFIFVFYKNIFSCSKFIGIYPGRPAAWRPGPGRPSAGRQGLICKKNRQKIAPRSLEDRPPGSRAASPPGRPTAGRRALAARLRGDRPPNPI